MAANDRCKLSCIGQSRLQPTISHSTQSNSRSGLTFRTMSTMTKRYFAPEIMTYEVVAERGYQASIEGPGFGLPGYGTESDELI